jgi:hypothetical protein
MKLPSRISFIQPNIRFQPDISYPDEYFLSDQISVIQMDIGYLLSGWISIIWRDIHYLAGYSVSDF